MSATVYGRQPLGIADGALAGTYPFPALGLVMPGGLFRWDDFIAAPASIVAGRYGDLLWVLGIFTTGPTWSAVTSTAWTNGPGIMQAITAASANTGGLLTSTGSAFYGALPIGGIWCTRIRMIGSPTAYELWSGFASGSVRVSAAAAVRFVGVRVDGSGNLFGVVKNGAAPAETTVDLGVSPSGGNWITAGFEVGGTTAAPTIQFFVLDRLGSNRQVWDRTDVGSPISTNIPVGAALPVAIGLITTDAVAKTAQIDHWGFGGRIARGA